MKTELIQIIESELNSNLFPNESNGEFIQRIVHIYLTLVRHQKGYTTLCLLKDVVEEIEFEAMEIFRVKTYGHFNIASYRRSKGQSRNFN